MKNIEHIIASRLTDKIDKRKIPLRWRMTTGKHLIEMIKEPYMCPMLETIHSVMKEITEEKK